jgi:hypothetical protein
MSTWKLECLVKIPLPEYPRTCKCMIHRMLEINHCLLLGELVLFDLIPHMCTVWYAYLPKPMTISYYGN